MHKMKVLGLLGIPLLAIAVAVMVFAIGHSSDTTEAATDGAAMSLRVDASQTFDCDGGPVAGKVCVNLGAKFDVIVVADSIPVANGYILAQGWIDYGPNLTDGGNIQALWPDIDVATFLTSVDAANNGLAAGGLTGLLSQPASFHKGDIYSFSLTCSTSQSSSTINLLPSGDEVAGTSGALYTEFNTTTQIVPSVASINVNCNPGPTNTPTATPPPIPRMSKSPALQNVFLTRQGAKVPPADCLSGTSIGGLTEGLSQDIVSPDPKDPSAFQQLAAFEFEVHYDSKKVCVSINVGEAFDAAGAVCIIEDSSSTPQLEGVARIGCVTIGKGHAIDALEALASVDVYPQPDVYSEMKPNQDNGNVVQINNVNCDLGDEQGHAIPIFSCDDADITFRYLEGDVEPDCVVDAVDAQAIAFRWGIEKGSQIYRDFMNLEPPRQQQDNDIDINDLQFVFGRFGSTCEEPHPVQDPVNPKA